MTNPTITEDPNDTPILVLLQQVIDHRADAAVAYRQEDFDRERRAATAYSAKRRVLEQRIRRLLDSHNQLVNQAAEREEG